MPLSRRQNILLGLVVVVCLTAIATGAYLYRSRHSKSLAESQSAPLPELVRQLPADSPAIAYIDVAALRELKGSPLASLLGLATSGPGEDRDYADFVRNTGFNYEHDLERAALGFWPVAAKSPHPSTDKSKIKSENKPESNDVLAIADGRFDEQKIQAYALRSGKMVTRGKHSIYQVPGNPPVFFEFLSATRVILASGINAEAHLLATDSPGINASILTLVDHVSGAPFFAVARADAVPQTIYASIGQPQLAKTIQRLTLAGRPQAESLQLALDAQCDSMASALQVTALLGGFRILGSMAMSDPKTKKQMTGQEAALLSALLTQTQITQQGNWVRVSLAVTPDILEAAAQH
jgi:hypothetical protein